MFDLLIRNGLIVDGTGTPGYRGDVALADGRIVEIGDIAHTATARRTIDAKGLVVCPGFIDPHTHYDAQVTWDPLLSCSSWHGVTTVIMGHCGVGLAPCKPEDRDAVAMDLVTIESIPFEALKQGVPWNWVSFAEYMDAAEQRGLGINVGFVAALTPFRRWVLGAEATERAATPEETTQIAALLREAVAAGAFGFSTTFLKHHFGDGGKPLGCRMASREELTAYANVLAELDRGIIELALSESGEIGETEHAILQHLVDESNRPVTWVFLLARDDKPQAAFDSLDRTAALIERGCRPQVMPTPLTIQFDLHTPAISLSNMPSWKPLFGADVATQMRAYADPAFRAAFAADLQAWGVKWPWDRTEVYGVKSPALQALVGKTVAAIAAERNAEPRDVFLDIALEDNLDLRYSVRLFNVDVERVGMLITDPRTLLGLSDAGAHIDVFCTADYTTHLLGAWVRDMRVLTLERAIQRITSEPAAFFGIRDRGKLERDLAGDIVVFDPETVDSMLRPEMIYDFPDSVGRLVTRSKGIHYTIVNGQVLYEPGQGTVGGTASARAGRVLRSTPGKAG
ncbi:amidohydrolase family protein [soil metagenome]